MTTRVGLVQLRTPNTQAAAFEQAAPLIRKAAAGGAKLILVDLSNATDVTPRTDSGTPLVYENVATDLAALGITPATSQVVLDVNLELPTITDFKLEGLSILNANTVAISNDNDFGIGDAPGRSTRIWQILLSQPLR